MEEKLNSYGPPCDGESQDCVLVKDLGFRVVGVSRECVEKERKDRLCGEYVEIGPRREWSACILLS